MRHWRVTAQRDWGGDIDQRVSPKRIAERPSRHCLMCLVGADRVLSRKVCGSAMPPFSAREIRPSISTTKQMQRQQLAKLTRTGTVLAKPAGPAVRRMDVATIIGPVFRTAPARGLDETPPTPPTAVCMPLISLTRAGQQRREKAEPNAHCDHQGTTGAARRQGCARRWWRAEAGCGCNRRILVIKPVRHDRVSFPRHPASTAIHAHHGRCDRPVRRRQRN